MKLRYLFVVFSVLFLMAGCDGGSDCVDNLTPFEECPTEGLARACNRFSCNSPSEGPPTLSFIIVPSDCEVVDCTTMECEFIGSASGNGLLMIDDIIPLAGTVLIDGEDQPVTFSCDPLVP